MFRQTRHLPEVKRGDTVIVDGEKGRVLDIDTREMYPIEVEFKDGFRGRYDNDDLRKVSYRCARCGGLKR